jgi:hypothetical protein
MAMDAFLYMTFFASITDKIFTELVTYKMSNTDPTAPGVNLGTHVG